MNLDSKGRNIRTKQWSKGEQTSAQEPTLKLHFISFSSDMTQFCLISTSSPSYPEAQNNWPQQILNSTRWDLSNDIWHMSCIDRDRYGIQLAETRRSWLAANTVLCPKSISSPENVKLTTFTVTKEFRFQGDTTFALNNGKRASEIAQKPV